MYSKVALSQLELRQLYREDLILGEDGRIVFRKARYFQEFLGALSYGDDARVVSKGQTLKICLTMPGHLPVKSPVENWFQVAMRRPFDEVDPLGLAARYKGFLPGQLIFDPETRFGEFRMEDDTDLELADYALFIYDRADYGKFLDEVQELLGRQLQKGRQIVRDRDGNTIMLSDSLTDQAMMLFPIALITGGKELVANRWRRLVDPAFDIEQQEKGR